MSEATVTNASDESDKAMADLARALARALCGYARDRDNDHKKQIAQLHTDLCAAYRAEIAERTAAETEAAE